MIINLESVPREAVSTDFHKNKIGIAYSLSNIGTGNSKK